MWCWVGNASARLNHAWQAAQLVPAAPQHEQTVARRVHSALPSPGHPTPWRLLTIICRSCRAGNQLVVHRPLHLDERMVALAAAISIDYGEAARCLWCIEGLHSTAIAIDVISGCCAPPSTIHPPPCIHPSCDSPTNHSWCVPAHHAADFFSRHSYGGGFLSPFMPVPVIPYPVPVPAGEAAEGAAAGAEGADAAAGAEGAAAGAPGGDLGGSGAAGTAGAAGSGEEPLERDLGGDGAEDQGWFGGWGGGNQQQVGTGCGRCMQGGSDWCAPRGATCVRAWLHQPHATQWHIKQWSVGWLCPPCRTMMAAGAAAATTMTRAAAPSLMSSTCSGRTKALLLLSFCTAWHQLANHTSQ